MDDQCHVLDHQKGRGMLMTRPVHTHGFSLIELIIAIALMSILMTFAMPMYSSYMHNQRIRSSAEGVLSGLQIARSEAVKQNRRVEFLLTDDEVDPSNASSAAAATGGASWMARALDTPTAGVHTYVDGRDGTEGTGSSTAGSLVAVTGSVGSVVFSALGTVEAGAATTTFDVASANPSTQGQCLASSGTVRCLRVVLTAGGQARMCDPSITTAGDTRRC